MKTVFSEDTAALVGLVLAAAGLGLHQLTGQAFWDAAAAIAIGVLLAVRGLPARPGHQGDADRRGRAGPGPRRHPRELAGHPEVDRVVDVRTMLLGPDALLVAARLDMDDALGAAEVEDSDRRDRRRSAAELPAGPRGLPGRHVRLRHSGGRDQPGGQQHEQQQRRGRPGTTTKTRDGVPGDEPQQPGDRGVARPRS